TTITGYALDSFVVLNENLTASGYRDLINFIEYQLHENICNSDIPFSKPTLYPRINRQLRHFPITPEVKLENRIKTGEYTILLLAGDRPGLLSVIAQVLHNAQINIQSARINTLGHRAEDSFYVRTKKLTDLEKKELQNALLEALETK
ncbi:MAG: ACT domain-containing protein, partial [Pseudomonadota bacterium]|nr:ACT domain-containing protein [Pseudomonadota bacterium]